MISKTIAVSVLAACFILAPSGGAFAFSGIQSDWQNYYNACPDLVTVSCNACHQNGFDFNPYGEALRHRIADLSMSNTAAFVDAEGVDSDGDGITNGQEIVVDCTLPGDASDVGTVPVETSSWDLVKACYR